MSAKCFSQAFWSKSSNGRLLLKRLLKSRPLLRYKDTCKMALQRSEVLNEWNAVVNDRNKWKHSYKMYAKCTTRKEKLTTRNEDRNVSNANT